MAADLLMELTPYLARIAAVRGLRRVVERRYEGFGDALVQLSSPEFDIRVVRDRGELFLQISAPGHEEWHEMEDVLDFLRQSAPQEGLDRRVEIDKLVGALDENYTTVAEIFDAGPQYNRFLDFERKRGQARSARLRNQ